MWVASELISKERTGVSVGSCSFRQPDAAIKVVEGLNDYCERHGVANITDLIGDMKMG